MRLAELLALASPRENCRIPPATLATLATLPGATPLTVATVATVARVQAENRGPNAAALLARLRQLAEAEGLPRAIVDGLTDADLDPDNGAHLLDDAGLRRWLYVRAENGEMQRGIAPPGWTQASHCERCGPVRLWTGAPLHVIGCPWCHVRRAGGIVPRPPVTCASCQHRQPRPDTSDPGMHGCAKGHTLHFAFDSHTCADWKPSDSVPPTPTEEHAP